MDSRTFDLRDLDHLPETAPEPELSTYAILQASRSGPVTLLLTPGTQPATKLATLCGTMLREARPGVWRLG